MPPKKKRKPRARARGQTGARAPQQARPDVEERVDPTERRRERIQQRREEKAKAQAAARRRYATRRVVRLITLAALLVVGVWFFFLRQQIPDAIAGIPIEDFDTFAAESRAQQLHTSGDVTYESVPPVSGPHNANPAPCGIFPSEIPEENMVHTLEHGAVGILYVPNELELDQIRALERIAQDYDSHVFTAPYLQQEDAITLVAWAHLMRLDSVDEAAIREFIDVFRQDGDAPETNQPCPMDSDSPFQPPTPTPTQTTPGDEPTGSDGGGGGDDGNNN